MKKAIALPGIVFLFFSCASSGADKSQQNFPSDTNVKTPSVSKQGTAEHWITRPSENTLTIIGVSSLQVKRDAEIAAAKEDAAQKAAMYHGIQGSIESFHNAGVNFFDYVADSKVELEYDTDYAKYFDRLTFDPEHDVTATDEAVFVRFRYAAMAVPVDFITSMNDDGRPNWTYSRDLPRIDGYLTAVGFARNQVRLRDTIRKSTEAAVARMIEDISTRIISNDKSATGAGASAMIQTKSEGKLDNFQTIEFWIDPKTGYVYTLAIARQGK
ncbi:MAG: hypothetical protein LBH20_04770 [Treponema sp.]|nr:hypothetical protein [Treponema sp.]